MSFPKLGTSYNHVEPGHLSDAPMDLLRLAVCWHDARGGLNLEANVICDGQACHIQPLVRVFTQVLVANADKEEKPGKEQGCEDREEEC